MNRAGERFLRAGYGSSIKTRILMPPHPLTNFWNTKVLSEWT